MVGLSELNLNLFDKLSNYMNVHDYNKVELESQCFSSKSLQSNDISSNNTEEVPERIVNKLVQQQKRLNTEEVSEIVDAYISGLTTYQLAKQFDCHRTTITYHLKAQGIKIRNCPLSEVQIDEAVKLYESGLSCLKIGKIIGANDTTVLKRLRERGVRVRGAHERKDNLVLAAARG